MIPRRSGLHRLHIVTAVACMIVFMLLVSSDFRQYGYLGSSRFFVVMQGKVLAGGKQEPAVVKGWFLEDPVTPNGVLATIYSPGSKHLVVISLGWLFCVLGIVSLTASRLSRRPRRGHCRKCDYDLTGNTSGICPECGTKIGTGR